MADVFTEIGMAVTNLVTTIVTGYEQQLATLAVYTFLMVIYGIVIWHYYRNLSKRDLFEVPPHSTFWNRLLNLFKYLIVFPMITFLWFLLLTVFLFFLAKTQATETVLLTAVTIVSAVRVAAYYNEDLSKDLAKMIPFALLGIFIIEPTFFSFELVVNRVQEFSALGPLVRRYLLFVILLEFVLRMSHNVGLWISSKVRKKSHR